MYPEFWNISSMARILCIDFIDYIYIYYIYILYIYILDIYIYILDIYIYRHCIRGSVLDTTHFFYLVGGCIIYYV